MRPYCTERIKGEEMLNEKKLREKIEELNNSKRDSIEWTESLERTDNITDGISVGNIMPDQRFMLKEMSSKFAKLYIYDNSLKMFVGIMIVER